MAQRMTKKTALKRVALVLTNLLVAEKGKLACIDTATGLVVLGTTATTLIPIGYFDEDKTGDGTVTVKIRLFQPVWVHWFENDGATAVVAADLLGPCYILDDETVTGDATGASVAGRVWALSTVDGVAVEIDGMNAGG